MLIHMLKLIQCYPIFHARNLIGSLRLPWSTYAALAVLVWASCVGPRQVKQLQAQQALFSNIPLTVTGIIRDITALHTGQSKRQLRLQINNSTPTLPTNLLPNLTLAVPYTYQLRLGDRLTLHGLKLQPSGSTAMGYRALRQQSWPAKLTANATYQVHAPASHTAHNWIYRYKNRLLTKLRAKLEPSAFSLLSTIFFGHRTASAPHLQQQLAQQLQIWGLAHFLARAGLHMILLALLLQLLLSWLALPRAPQHLALITLVSFYALISWDSLSFGRALLLVMMSEVARLRHLQLDRLHLLNLILIGWLLYQPVQLFFLDFQLSFALTYALVLLFRQNRYPTIAPA